VSQANGTVTFSSDGHQGAVSSYVWAAGAKSILGCEVSVEVSQVAAAGADVNGVFQFADPMNVQSSAVVFAERGGQLSFVTKANGTSTATQITYDPNAHRYWRLRESAGTVFYETSPDASAWTVQQHIATPSWASAGVVVIGAGAVTNTAAGAFSFTALE